MGILETGNWKLWISVASYLQGKPPSSLPEATGSGLWDQLSNVPLEVNLG